MTAGPTIVRSTPASRLALIAAAVLIVAFALVPVWSDSGTMRKIVEFLSLLALAQMWNLLAGYTGLVSIGQQAYIGIGGYALHVLADFAGIDPFVAVPLAGLVAAAVAIPTGLLVFRFQGGYFAIGTWVVAEIYFLAVNSIEALGGGFGRSLQALRGISRSFRERVTYWLALAIGVAAIAGTFLLLRSRRGLALTAIRDSESAARSIGVNVFRNKFVVYVLASCGCGAVGALIYLNLLRIVPFRAFHVDWSAFMIFIVVIGGIGTIEGPIIGTLIFFLLREYLSDFGSWYLIALGLLAVVVMLRAPDGVWGLVRKRWGAELFPVGRKVRLDLDFRLPETGTAPDLETRD